MIIPVFYANPFQMVALVSIIFLFFALYWRRNSQPSPARQFTIRIASTVLILMSIIIILNVLVNPFDTSGVHLFESNAINVRVRKPQMVTELREPPELIILGSSRSMTLDPRQVEETCGFSAFNASLFSVHTEELLSFYKFLEDHDTPRYLIVGLEIPAFSNQDAYGAALAGTPLFSYFEIPPRKRFTEYVRLFSSFISPNMTQESIRILKFSLTDSFPPPRIEVDELGKLDYRNYGETGNVGVDSEQFDNRTLDLYDELSPQRVDDLRELTRRATQDGTEVYYFLTPHFPAYYEINSTNHPNFEARHDDLRKVLAELETQYGITWYDFTTVDKFGGNPLDFYDGVHYGVENSTLVLGTILKDVCGAV